MGGGGGWAVMEGGDSRSQTQLYNCFSAPTGSAPGSFLDGESAHGHPSLVEPTGKSAQAIAAQPDWTRSGELPRGPTPVWEQKSWLWGKESEGCGEGLSGEHVRATIGTRTRPEARGQLLRQEYHLKAWLRPRAKSYLGPTPGWEPSGPGNLTIPVTH